MRDGLLTADISGARADVGRDLGTQPYAAGELVPYTFTVKNNVDIASDGHVWALDDYLQHVQVWKLSAKHYCFKIEYDGTWRSFAGTSYAGTGTIAEEDFPEGPPGGTETSAERAAPAARPPVVGVVRAPG